MQKPQAIQEYYGRTLLILFAMLTSLFSEEEKDLMLLHQGLLIIKLLIDNSFVAGVRAKSDAITALKRQNA